MEPLPDEVFLEPSSLDILGARVVAEDGHGVDALLLAEVRQDGGRRLEGLGQVTLEPRNRARPRLTESGRLSENGFYCTVLQ